MLVDKTLCNGCWACVNVCNQNALKMNEDTEGFLYPVIDISKCKNCNACNRVCPALKNHFKPKRSRTKYGIAVRSDKYATGSTSGGAFAFMANKVLSMGGYGAGAVFNNEWKVEHIVTDRVEDTDRMRGSKYLQSDINTTYKETKSLLDNGKYVLFSGTPCQIAGLYGFLGKDYENLLTVDLICHGVNSPMVWKKYLDELTEGEEISSIIFRNKGINLLSCHCDAGKEYFTIRFANGNIFTNTLEENDFIKGFFQHLYLRPNCACCHYAGRIRYGDITIGDLWTDEAAEDRKKGISQILINSKKGRLFFKSLEDDWSKKFNINLDKTKESAPNINGFVFNHNPSRSRFFALIQTKSFKEALCMTIKNKYDVAIVGMHAVNYGNLLTAYAMYKTITDLGKAVLMLDRPLTSKDKPSKSVFETFQQNPYPEYAVSKIYPDKNSMKELNDRINIFLLPSDQVLRPLLFLRFDKYTLLDWVRDDKPKIAYSSSFGTEFFEEDENLRAEVGFYLSRFDAISVREESGIRYAKDNFGIDVEQVLDPVFLCNPGIYKEMAMKNESRLPKEPFLGGYFIFPTEYRLKIIDDLLILLNLNHHSMICMNNYRNDREHSLWNKKGVLENVRVEEFLACIQNCELFVTDSFHGICFSIIFRKQFIVISDYEFQNKASTRIICLLKKLNLKDRIVTSFSEIKNKNILENPINYDAVYNILNPEIVRSMTWLKNTLDKISLLRKNKSVYDIMNERIREIEQKYTNRNNKLKKKIRWLFRKTKGFFRCLKQKGIIYTAKLLIKKSLAFLFGIKK